ncbi:MAG: S41 family peptidase [Candidatus Omnitrophota bacterium]
MRNKLIFSSALVILLFGSASLAISFERNKRDDLYRQVEIFSDVLAIVDSEYVDEVKPKDEIYGALKGMVSSLDPHSQFMDPQAYNELKEDTEGKFGGLGIEISVRNGGLVIISPLEGTPAWKAGLKPGDKIVKINAVSTSGIGLDEAMRKLRGNPKEAVSLTVSRGPGKKLLEFKITRAIIKINDIKQAKILEDGIGYIQIVEFRESTPKDFNVAIEKLSGLGIKALILDLRNNPGGLMESALEITGKFIPEGKLIVSSKGRKQNQNLEFKSEDKHPLLKLPLAILINAGSASGSEIIAAALQDYKRALILGEKSFGKGSIQTVIPLSDGSALRLTTSKYFTPLGKGIDGKGVSPDVLIGNPADDEEKEIIEGPGLGQEPDKGKKAPDYKSDPAVMAAVNLLKTKQ